MGHTVGRRQVLPGFPDFFRASRTAASSFPASPADHLIYQAAVRAQSLNRGDPILAAPHAMAQFKTLMQRSVITESPSDARGSVCSGNSLPGQHALPPDMWGQIYSHFDAGDLLNLSATYMASMSPLFRRKLVDALANRVLGFEHTPSRGQSWSEHIDKLNKEPSLMTRFFTVAGDMSRARLLANGCLGLGTSQDLVVALTYGHRLDRFDFPGDFRISCPTLLVHAARICPNVVTENILRGTMAERIARAEFVVKYVPESWSALPAGLGEVRPVFLMAARSRLSRIEQLPSHLAGDKEIVLEIAKNHPRALWAMSNRAVSAMSEKILNCKENGLAVLQACPSLLEFASLGLRDDRDLMLAALRMSPFHWRFVGEALRHDRELFLVAVRQAPRLLKDAGETLQNDREVVLAAVRQDGMCLTYAADALRYDPSIRQASMNF